MGLLIDITIIANTVEMVSSKLQLTAESWIKKKTIDRSTGSHGIRPEESTNSYIDRWTI